MADPVPTVIECTGTCTVTLRHEVSLMPFDMTFDDGKQLAMAILLVWSVAWIYRVLENFLAEKDSPSAGD